MRAMNPYVPGGPYVLSSPGCGCRSGDACSQAHAGGREERALHESPSARQTGLLYPCREMGWRETPLSPSTFIASS